MNGRIERNPSRRVAPSDSVEALDYRWVPEKRAPSAIPVIYEDDDVLAIDKPPGLPTHATADAARDNAVDLMSARYGPLFVQQRLDAETSGVLLFARNPEAARALTESIAARRATKVYVALVPRGKGSRDRRAWTIDAPLRALKNGRVAVDDGGEEALTRVRFVSAGPDPDHALVEAEPVTGRKHQIRAHLAHAGYPIVGDGRYGGDRAERLFLHARRLEITHPRTGVPLRIESAIPDAFRAELSRRSRASPRRRGR